MKLTDEQVAEWQETVCRPVVAWLVVEGRARMLPVITRLWQRKAKLGMYAYHEGAYSEGERVAANEALKALAGWMFALADGATLEPPSIVLVTLLFVMEALEMGSWRVLEQSGRANADAARLEQDASLLIAELRRRIRDGLTGVGLGVSLAAQDPATA